MNHDKNVTTTIGHLIDGKPVVCNELAVDQVADGRCDVLVVVHDDYK